MSFKPLNQYPQQPLNSMQTQLLFNLLMGELAPIGEIDTAMQAALESDFVAKVVSKRLEVFGGQATPELIALISVLAEGNPGTGLMIAHAVHMSTPIGETSSCTTFAETFQMGIANQADFSVAWDGQKYDNGNLIDVKSEWERK